MRPQLFLAALERVGRADVGTAQALVAIIPALVVGRTRVRKPFARDNIPWAPPRCLHVVESDDEIVCRCIEGLVVCVFTTRSLVCENTAVTESQPHAASEIQRVFTLSPIHLCDAGADAAQAFVFSAAVAPHDAVRPVCCVRGPGLRRYVFDDAGARGCVVRELDGIDRPPGPYGDTCDTRRREPAFGLGDRRVDRARPLWPTAHGDDRPDGKYREDESMVDACPARQPEWAERQHARSFTRITHRRYEHDPPAAPSDAEH